MRNVVVHTPQLRSSLVETPEQQISEYRKRKEAEFATRKTFEEWCQSVRAGCLGIVALPNDPNTRAHALALATLAGIKFHVVNTNSADAHDALAIRDDIETLAKIIDPLLASIGFQLQVHFGGVDQSNFKNVLLDAVTGNATYEATKCAERWQENEQEYGE